MRTADPLGAERARGTRKPTEKHLDRLINSYRREYEARARGGVDAVVNLARESGASTHVLEAQALFMRNLNPVRESARPTVDLAVRLGASRVPDTPPEAVDQMAARIVPRVDDQRARMMVKTASDFAHRVVGPALGLAGFLVTSLLNAAPPPPGDEPTITSPQFVSPNEFTTTSPDGTLVFTQETLDNLQRDGYDFARVRAVEAAQSDVWAGDDLGYLASASRAGIMMVEWRVSPDELVCPVCSDLDGEEYTLGEAERVSMDRAWATHPHCRCWFSSVDPTES